MIYINDIKLEGKSEFTQQFNLCSDLLTQAREAGLSEEERGRRFNVYFTEKLKLEQGWY